MYGISEAAHDRAVSRRTLLRGAGALAIGGGLMAAGTSAAHAATSQNGWPAGTATQIPLTALTVGAAMFPAGVRAGQVATILGYVARRFNAEVEPLVGGWCWGHNYRVIVGGTSLSNHASGTAIDVNAPRHPLGASGTFTTTQRARISAILTACNGVVRWGGNYSGRKDEMHFEINVPPGDARLTALVSKIQGGTTTTWTTVQAGNTGFRVTAIQHLLRHRGYALTVDGSFGAVTKSKVMAFQSSRGLTADGIVGPKTWSALVVVCQRGATGQAVVALQKTLIYRGYPLTADGSFGAITQDKVTAFQRSRGLPADGIAGLTTWAKLTV